ncbi:MAG TPA: MarR family transcriptional regulator [Chryseolinea sp.]|nr:MarR family transcriptional regulator [Chryseolinea sp.]
MKIEEEIKQTKFKNSHQKAVINLLYTTGWLLGRQKEIFKPFNITLQQFNMLRILRGQHPNSTSATEIKSRMLDKNSDVSRLLDRLLAKGIISKKTSVSDKRAADITLTEEGLELLRALDKKQSQIDNVLLLNDEDAALLSDLLDKSRG